MRRCNPTARCQIQVPAQVPFTIDVLDANARRITAQHTSWMQVQPGEIKSCNGCHTAGNLTTPRTAAAASRPPVNKGAPTTGSPFPGTYSALFANAGRDDGANARAHQLRDRQRAREPAGALHAAVFADSRDRRHLCAGLDERRHDAAGRREYRLSTTARASRGASTQAIPSTPPMIIGNCIPWSAQCRITIHYANPASNPTRALHSESVDDRARARGQRRRRRRRAPTATTR